MMLYLLQMKLLSKDFGKHLLEVEDLLQKHTLQEADITVQADRVQTLNAAALKFTSIDGTLNCNNNCCTLDRSPNFYEQALTHTFAPINNLE